MLAATSDTTLFAIDKAASTRLAGRRSSVASSGFGSDSKVLRPFYRRRLPKFWVCFQPEPLEPLEPLFRSLAVPAVPAGGNTSDASGTTQTRASPPPPQT
eukprot:1194258-Prorocentrum_minimum.AAC.8